MQQAALAVVVNPQARRVELHSDRSANAVDVVFLPDGQAYILQSALPALGAGQTYQLWGLVGGRTKVSLGLLGRQPTTTAFRLDPSLVSLLAVTAQPAGGVAATDKPAVAWANVPTVR